MAISARRLLALTALVFALPIQNLCAQSLKIQRFTSDDPLNAWRSVTYPGGKTAKFTVGIGSAAARNPKDPPNSVYVMSDRGPNFTCGAAKKIIGAASQPLCGGVKHGRFYPTPDYTPSIYRLELDRAAGTFAIKDVISLKTASGKAISGLLNPQKVALTDVALDLEGKKLPHDVNAVDAEGLVRLSDGSFWIGEEMAPSIAHVSPEGRILKRFVPANAGADYAKADTEIVATLPAILSKRQPNRGIESLAVSPDEKFLYFMLQNPLANPDVKAYRAAKNTRLFKFDREKEKLVGEYVYQLDDPQTFALDPSNKQYAPRVSEMTDLGLDRLLVLERTDGTTKLNEIKLAGATNILGGKWDDVATTPTLEQQNDLAKLGITPVKKTLRFDTARDFKAAPKKLEGMALLGDGSLFLINDNDFGIEDGTRTEALVVKGAVKGDSN